MKRFPILILLTIAACAPLRPFEPVDAEQAQAPGGYRAAAYEISGGHGDWNNVVVQVWTLGVSRETKTAQNKNPRTFLDLQWRIANHSQAPVRLDLGQTRLLLSTGTTDRPYVGAPESSAVPTAVSPGSENTFSASFPLPAGTDAQRLYEFEVSWVLTGDAQNYGQTTRFERPQNQSTLQPNIGIGLGVGF
jgi:hypothetical protein